MAQSDARERQADASAATGQSGDPSAQRQALDGAKTRVGGSGENGWRLTGYCTEPAAADRVRCVMGRDSPRKVPQFHVKAASASFVNGSGIPADLN